MNQKNKYKKLKQKIGSKEYTLYVANTPKKRKLGLSKMKINNREGMIFIYSEPIKNLTFTMKNTNKKLKLIFVNENEEIVHQAIGMPNQTKNIVCPFLAKYVIEILG